MGNREIKSLKKKMLGQLKTQGFTDIDDCGLLIAMAEQERDDDSIAMGHIWLAEAFLTKENKIECSRELEKARGYISEQKPTEILEKYYFIEYKLYTALYDTQTAFDYCLKALRVSEQLYENQDLIHESQQCFINGVGNRVVGNYGNVGINFFNQGIYQKALLYCNKALLILKTLEAVNVYAECLLRLNVIISLIKTDTASDIIPRIHIMEQLPIEKESLKIYIDYAYTNYYLYIKDEVNVRKYISELLNDQVEKYADRMTAIDFYIDILEPVIESRLIDQAELLFEEIERLLNDDISEIRPALRLARLKIAYENTVGNNNDTALYKEYYELYLKGEKLTNSLKISGLETRLKLHEIEKDNTRAKLQLHLLEDIANFDELTKIFNRRYLNLKYDELLNSNISLLSLAIIDVDFFKEYNDTYGHLAGDETLKKVAKCLQESLFERMIACRYGGDEFVALSWDDSLDTMGLYVQRVVESVADMSIEHETSRCSNRVTISIGYGSKRIKMQSSIQNLFEEADKALYLAKERGRNQIAKLPEKRDDNDG